MSGKLTLTAAYVFLFFSSSLTILLNGQNSYFAHSEMWAVASSRLLGQIGSDALSTYYKVVFYALLKPLYWMDLSNYNHLLAARLIFSVIGIINLAILANVLNKILKNSWITLFSLLFLLSEGTFFSQAFRIRSDSLSCFFALLCLNRLVTITENKTKIFLPKIFCFSLLAFLATPKSIYIILCLAIFSLWNLTWMRWQHRFMFVLLNFLFPVASVIGGSFLMNYWPEMKGSIIVLIFGLILIWLFLKNQESKIEIDGRLCFFIFGVVFGTILWLPHWSYDFSDPYALALNYYIEGFTKDFFNPRQWVYIFDIAKYSPFHLLIFLLSLVNLFTVAKKSYFWLSISILFVLLFHNEKWPFFIFSLLPFLTISVGFLVKRLGKHTLKVLLPTTILLLFSPLLFRSSEYKTDNREQKLAINYLESLTQQVSDPLIFDSTGLLPRANNLLAFLGPNDVQGVANALAQIKRTLPDFIFYTSKIHFIEPEIFQFLKEHYVELNRDVWIHRRHTSELGQMKVSAQVDFNLKRVSSFDIR